MNFSLIQSGLIVCMGALQVFVVRFFFQVWAYPTYTFAGPPFNTDVLSRARARAMYKRQRWGSVLHVLQHTAAVTPKYVRCISWQESQLVSGERKVDPCWVKG